MSAELQGVKSIGRITWMSTKRQFESLFADRVHEVDALDHWIAGQSTMTGYCTACRSMRVFKVFGGALFGSGVNLREGLVCSGCFMSNRQRFMLEAAEQTWASPTSGILLLETMSALVPAIVGRYSSVLTSEYVASDARGGVEYERRGSRVRHEDATRLSLSSDSLDGVIHNDVLEHVPEYRRSFDEVRRVLKPGGTVLFTCPFFVSRDDHLVRAEIQPDGQVRHFEEPEFHGDPLNDEGILAYYHFGWKLLADLAETGFREVEIGVSYAPSCGFTGNAFPGRYGSMLPTVLRARK
jgi:SAM-dependent methyltransferase